MTSFGIGCASSRPRGADSVPKVPIVLVSPPPAPIEVPLGPEQPQGPSFAEYPQAAAKSSDSIVLVLGPGLASGFVHDGVLRALRDLRIPIRAIYATETGALVSALYLAFPNANRYDWASLQFGEAELKAPGGGVFSSQKSGRFEDKLEKVLGDRTIESLRAPRLYVVTENTKTASPEILVRGRLSSAIRAAFAGASGQEASNDFGRPLESARRVRPYALEDARFAYPDDAVVLVSTTSSGIDPKEAGARSALWLSVSVAGANDFDYKRKKDFSYAGRQAVLAKKNEIYSLIGRELEPAEEAVEP